MNRSTVITLLIAGSLTSAFIITPRLFLIFFLLGFGILGLIILLFLLNHVVASLLGEDDWSTIISGKWKRRKLKQK